MECIFKIHKNKCFQYICTILIEIIKMYQLIYVPQIYNERFLLSRKHYNYILFISPLLNVFECHKFDLTPFIYFSFKATNYLITYLLSFQLGMGFFRLGTLAALLSDPLVNGFTTGAAVHVTVSQLKDVLGVQVPRYKGAFKIVFTVIDLFKSIPSTNVVALTICVCIMIFMTICNEFLKPCLSKRCRLPFPGELISVIGGTLVSRLLQLNENYGVTLVGDIPKGLPMPELPRMDLIPVVAVDSIAIAIVSFSVVMSMGLTFAKKHSYEVRANQELFALGMANCISSCFSCYPLACSLSRSVIQEQTGGVTQLASLVSAVLIIMTLLWMGPFFSTLPRVSGC